MVRRPPIPRAEAASGVVVAAAALLLAGCVAQPRPPALVDPVLAACEARWDQERAASVSAGVLHAALQPVPGFPHYRSTRLLASFAEEARTPEAAREWTDRLRAAALEAADRERQRRQAAELPEALHDCARRLQAADLADPGRIARLRAAVEVPDDYSLTARVLGAYPLARPFLGLGIASYREGVIADYERPLLPRAPLQRYRPPLSVPPPPDLAAAPRSALGFPQLTATEWDALAQQHAPLWEIETAGDDDRPVRPDRGPDGRLQGVPEAVTYWYLDATRFYDQVLPTLVYTLWFPARTPEGRFDPYAGPLDGLVWRVVLDPQGEPWVYDSIHPCGCYRYTFPRADLRPRPPVPGQEPPLMPQTSGLPPPLLRLRVRAGDHQLLRVLPAEPSAAPTDETYALRPYAELEAGRLFGADGLVAGSERGERWWLWPSGVPSPGTMRQRGRQPTAFIGRAHFDDARYLETLFFPPNGGP